MIKILLEKRVICLDFQFLWSYIYSLFIDKKNLRIYIKLKRKIDSCESFEIYYKRIVCFHRNFYCIYNIYLFSKRYYILQWIFNKIKITHRIINPPGFVFIYTNIFKTYVYLNNIFNLYIYCNNCNNFTFANSYIIKINLDLRLCMSNINVFLGFFFVYIHTCILNDLLPYIRIQFFAYTHLFSYYIQNKHTYKIKHICINKFILQ